MGRISILVCDECGKKGKKGNTTGWVSASVDVNIYRKKGNTWFRKGKKKDSYYAYKQFCCLECMNIWFDSLVVTGKLSNKVAKLLKAQKKQGKRKGRS